jgi:hypothetical protein
MFEQKRFAGRHLLTFESQKLNYFNTLNIFYCSKRQKDKTQVKQLRQSSPITYISKYTIEHNNI